MQEALIAVTTHPATGAVGAISLVDDEFGLWATIRNEGTKDSPVWSTQLSTSGSGSLETDDVRNDARAAIRFADAVDRIAELAAQRGGIPATELLHVLTAGRSFEIIHGIRILSPSEES